MTTANAKRSTVKAIADEAADTDTFEFEHDGDTYKVSRESMNDVDVLEQFEDGKIVTPLRSLLGPDQWATYKSKKRSGEDLGTLAESMFKGLGTTAGESSG